jgi:hypothetical protein
MDISKHLNLINNHGYDGYIAIYEGDNQLYIKKGTIVLVKNQRISRIEDVGEKTHQWEKNHRTIEFPHSEEHIQENIKNNGHKGIIAFCTCVGVPVKLLKEIKTK